uniref:Uncharacterized protein n=2 Tax=Triticum urartu TaxID=4572 RepID=A0A8R7US25_TRIUA
MRLEQFAVQCPFPKLLQNEGQQDGVEGIPGLPWGCRSTRGGRGQHEKIKYELFDNARYLQKPHTWSNWVILVNVVTRCGHDFRDGFVDIYTLVMACNTVVICNVVFTPE